MFSSLYADVGVWTVTLKATLQNYAAVAPATSQFTVTVTDPCPLTSIYPLAALPNLTINLQDTVPVTSLLFIKLSFEDSYGFAGTCGTRTYASDSTMVSVLPPASGALFNDNWTVSAVA